MSDGVTCRRRSCPRNGGGTCGEPYSSSYCDKELFRCKRCGHGEWMNDPASREECPSCRSTLWDLDPDVKRRNAVKEGNL